MQEKIPAIIALFILLKVLNKWTDFRAGKDVEKDIEPYEKTLNTMSANDIKKWASGVISKLREGADLEKDMFTLLAGINYRKYLLPQIKHFKIPLKGVTIGKQLKYLKQKAQI